MRLRPAPSAERTANSCRRACTLAICRPARFTQQSRRTARAMLWMSSGGLAGGLVGTAAEPGGGTIGGALLGSEGGASIGTSAGGGVGAAFGYLACASGGGNGGAKSQSQKFNPRNPAHRKLTGEQIISRFKQGSIRGQFPSQYLGSTFNEIDREAGEGIDAAQTARKLLTAS